MRFVPMNPPRDEAKAREMFPVILKAALDLGVTLEAQGFATSWLSDSTRTFIGTEDGKTVAFAHMAFGRRFHEAEFSASIIVLAAATPEHRLQVLQALSESAQMLGARVMLFEGVENEQFPSEPLPLRVHTIE